MMTKHLEEICLALVILAVVPLWAQTDSPSTEPPPAASGPEGMDDQMFTPPPVSGEAFSSTFTTEDRSNYLRGGVGFSSAYSDNAVGAVNGHQVSDVSFYVSPMLALDKTIPRLHWVLTYAPGFTFYQHTSSRDQADQNASISFQYRLTEHVTLTAQDGFNKSSNVFNQPDLAPVGTVSGGAGVANFSVIPPIANRLSNSGSVGLTYQYGLNAMVGASGSFTNLHYPDLTQVPGLYDASSQAGTAFYSHRISGMHYLGASYQYQRLLSYPTLGLSETQTHALFFFYTLYPTSRFSVSLFGGPQRSDTQLPGQFQAAKAVSWSPVAGTSLSWQGRLSSLAVSYAHTIATGGGLIGAVRMDSANAFMRRALTRHINLSLAGTYAKNDVLGILLPGTSVGRSISGTAAVDQQLGQHLDFTLGYTRLNEIYRNVAILSSTPDTNRGFVSLSYQFSRPLGR